MNKIAKIVFISLFSFTATIKPFASTKQYLPSFISATYADPGEGLPVISDDQVNNLIEYCKEETEKTDEECENEVTQQNINDDEVSAVQKENEEFAQSFGVNHTSVTLIISAALQAIGTIIGFFGGGYKFPSNYLSLAVNCVLVIGFWVNLAKYNNYTKKLKNQNYETDENGQVNQVKFYSDQIQILKDSKPYIENIETTFNISIGITYATITASVIESIFCIITSGAYCACSDKKEKPNNLMNLFFPTTVNADAETELQSDTQLAKATIAQTKVDVDVDNWRKMIGTVVITVLESVFKASGAGITTLSMLALNELLKLIFKEAIAEGIARIAAFVKTVIFIVDQVGYYKNKEIYVTAIDEIDTRILKLQELSTITQNALNTNSGGQKSDGSSSTTSSLGGSFSTQTVSSDHLGAGDCNNFNYKNPTPEPTTCDLAKVVMPKPKQLDTSGIAGLDSFADALDPTPIFDNVKRALTTKEGVKSSEFTKNAKKTKKLLPKLLKMMKKKKIVFDKNQKKKDVKPLYLQVMETAKKRNATIASLSNKLFKDTAKEKNIKPEKIIKSEKLNKPYKPSPLNLPKMPTIDLSMDDDEQENISESKAANYGALDKFESSAEDIVKKKGVSLWKVISVRYQKSAYDDLLELKKK